MSGNYTNRTTEQILTDEKPDVIHFFGTEFLYTSYFIKIASEEGYKDKGMVGTALVNNLKNIRDGKNKTRPDLYIDEIYEYDLNSTAEELDEYCQKADFVFNLAGVNRPENPEDFMKGNFGFASKLLNSLAQFQVGVIHRGGWSRFDSGT